MLACVDKNIAFGVALRLLNSQWKMHHCDVLCLVVSFLCSLQAYNYAEHLYFCALNSSPSTHFTRAPPSPAKNRYLNSRLMILHASELAIELRIRRGPESKMYVAKLPAWSRHVHGNTQYKMASNIQLTTGRDREIAGLILLFR